MSISPTLDAKLREAILSQPNVILDDKDLMQALITANEPAMGGNIVDLRGIVMERLKSSLERREDKHSSVIAAAHENLASTHQVHSAILRMLEPVGFEAFLRDMGGAVTEILQVDSTKLVLETEQSDSEATAKRWGEFLGVVQPGFVDDYLSRGLDEQVNKVTLRQTDNSSNVIFGENAGWIRSEACLKLDFGNERLPGLLVMGAKDPNRFEPQQGTNLLAFFAGVFERAMRRWLP